MTRQTESRCKIRKTGGLARLIGIGLFGGMMMLGGAERVYAGANAVATANEMMSHNPLISPKYRENAAASAAYLRHMEQVGDDMNAKEEKDAYDKKIAELQQQNAQILENQRRLLEEQGGRNNYEQSQREQDILFACTRVENTNANGRIEIGNFKDVRNEFSVTNNIILGAKILNYKNHPVKLKFSIGKVLKCNDNGSVLYANEHTEEYDVPANQGVIYCMGLNKQLSAGKYALVVEKDAKTDKVEFVDVK